jgi:aryl-alcohol dehydrogenase-like predicted oxidoreductase
MDKRKLGNSGLAIAPLIFGGNVFGWTADEATSCKLLDAFLAAGFDCIDTADVYSKWVPGHRGGESEAIVGNWLKARGNRDKVVIATKVGMEMPGIGQGPPPRPTSWRAWRTLLKRLQTDYIDLYQSHCDDKEAPLEETLGAYQRLIEQGKVRAIGASNYEAPRLEAALKTSAEHKLPRYDTLQPLYNLSDRAGFESALQGLCVKANVGVIPYYALAAGFSHGQIPLGGGFRQEPARGSHARLSRSTRPPHPCRARYGGGTVPGDAGASGAGLVARPPGHRGADRQRHLAEPARRVGARHSAHARCRRRGRARHGECLKVVPRTDAAGAAWGC